MSNHQDTILYKAIGIQGVGYAVYLFFTGANMGGPAYLSDTGLFLAGLIIMFSGLVLFKSPEARSKTAGSLFAIAGLATLVAGVLDSRPLIGGSETIETLAIGLYIALVSMANPTLGLVILKKYSDNRIVTYSTALYMASPILLVYGLTGLSIAVLVASTLIYVELKGLPEQAEALNKAIGRVVKEISD